VGECFVEGLGGVQIATGSYKGTGTYGPSNPNSLTFPFVPKVVFIQQASQSCGMSGTFFQGMKLSANTYAAQAVLSYSAAGCITTWSNEGKTVTWYSADTSTTYPGLGQFNVNTTNYSDFSDAKYVAIG